jgi:hypothetical protein
VLATSTYITIAVLDFKGARHHGEDLLGDGCYVDEQEVRKIETMVRKVLRVFARW